MINRIVGTARIEPTTMMPRVNGNTITKQDKGVIMANTLANPFSPYKVVNIYDKPVSFETFVSGDPDVVLTRGIYTITYVPTLTGNKHHRPFRISQDLVKGTFTVNDWRHFHRCCAAIPELGWLMRNTNVSKELFGIAKQHPGMGFQFTIDWIRYSKLVTEKAQAENLDIDHKPFVSYTCSYKDFDDKYRNKTVAKPKTIHDYKAEFDSALNKED